MGEWNSNLLIGILLIALVSSAGTAGLGIPALAAEEAVVHSGSDDWSDGTGGESFVGTEIAIFSASDSDDDSIALQPEKTGGFYESAAIDAGSDADWKTISWTGKTSYELASDSSTLLLCHFNGNTACTGGEVPEYSFGINFLAGVHGKGVFVENGINELINPGAERGSIAGWTRWNQENVDANVALSQKVEGYYSFFLAGKGSSGYGGLAQDFVLPSDEDYEANRTFILTAKIKTNNLGSVKNVKNAYVQVSGYRGDTVLWTYVSSKLSGSIDWTEVKLRTGTRGESGISREDRADRIKVLLLIDNSLSGEAYFDNVQLAEKADPVYPYADEGPDELRYSKDNVNAESGSAAMWVTLQKDAGDAGFFEARDDAGKSIIIGIQGTTKQAYCSYNGIAVAAGTDSWKRGETHHVACTWSTQDKELSLYVDGALARSLSVPGSKFIARSEIDAVFIGQKKVTSQAGFTFQAVVEDSRADAVIDELLVSEKRLAADEVRRIYSAGVQGSSVKVKTKTSDDNIMWSDWSAAYADPAGSSIEDDDSGWRYLKYRVELNSPSAGTTPYLATPYLDEMRITYDTAGISEIPVVTLVSPLNKAQMEADWAFMNCTAKDNIDLSNLEIYTYTSYAADNSQGTLLKDKSFDVAGDIKWSFMTFNYTDLQNGTFYWNCKAVDSDGNAAWGESKYMFFVGSCVDMDNDGYYSKTGTCAGGTDCDDNDESVNPGAEEICNDSADNDCDGQADSADAECAGACTPGDEKVCGTDVGVCESGVQKCSSDGKWGSCVGEVVPQAEICGNGLDEDCNGLPDDGCVCTSGQTKSCGPDVEMGICRKGTQACTSEGLWGTCTGAIFPDVYERCGNGLDDNCNGQADEGCATCNDGVMNSDEEGVDCGGSDCSPCVGWVWIIIVVVLGLVVVAIILLVFLLRRRGSELPEMEPEREPPRPRRPLPREPDYGPGEY